MRRLLALSVGVLLWLSIPGTPVASADLFGPVELASTSAVAGTLAQQAEEARFPVISENGQYVAFVGRYGGVPGIWRRDLTSGAVEQVAPGNATMPSISTEGRYVSFTTNESLVPEDTNKSPDVYRRDMEPAGGESVFTLVSAVNGSNEGASYTYTGSQHITQLQAETKFGSLAGARSAMSANGNEVAFITTAQSNLLGGAEPTPVGEVLVRNIESGETNLVSAEYEPGGGWSERPVPPVTNGEGVTSYGAVFPSGESTPEFGTPSFPSPEDGQARWLGASISADGNVVTWMGQHLEKQTRLLPQEQGTEQPETAEPLWRDIDEGPNAPIRRVTGGSDPTNPQCEASGELTIPERLPSSLDPCSGPFERYDAQGHEGLWGSKVRADFVPQLSANGMTVAFITGARELASGEQQFAEAESTDDLYVVNMASGLTRVQSLRRLTEIGGGGNTQEKIEKSAIISDYSVSADGSQVAFTTERTQFPLGSPAVVSALAAAPGMHELFDVDLNNDTLTRVTHGYEEEGERSEELPILETPGVDPYRDEQGAYSPSFSEDGNTICFASSANNLVYGDGNDAPDAFVVHRVMPTAGNVQQYVSPTPPNPALVPPRRVGVTATSLANGNVRLYVEVPGTGALSARADGTILIHHSARGAARGARRRGKAVTLATRTVASTHMSVGATEAGFVAMTLSLQAAYRQLASSGGLTANVTVTFSVPGLPDLNASVRVKFILTAYKAVPKKAASHEHRGGRRAPHAGPARRGPG